MFRPALIVSLSALLISCGPSVIEETRQATGVKIGEVDSTSAIVWTRVTARPERSAEGEERRGRPDRDNPEYDLDPHTLEGSVPGAPGRVRVRYWPRTDSDEAVVTGWRDVSAEDDYTAQFELAGLEPWTVYDLEIQTAEPDGTPHQPARAEFRTAPQPDAYRNVNFTVITGQAYRDADLPDGFKIYNAMRTLEPEFIVPTGDTVYYDSDAPMATSVELARYHWHRMYSYPTLIEFHRRVPGYWEKDDHDSFHNDNWPGMEVDYMGSFSWEKGLKVFAEQVPHPDKPYRTFRWGQGLQVWIVEGRDFRSPNPMPDGPDKTIWGEEQKQWLTETLLASDADWKVLVSPTPIVGPDRSNKADNHANKAFQHEGDWFRNWAADNLGDDFFIACGDRHWQYHSVHPETGVQEFSSGPASDQHAGGTPGLHEMHEFHRVQGGFLEVETLVEDGESVIAFRLRDVDGNVVYEHAARKPKS